MDQPKIERYVQWGNWALSLIDTDGTLYSVSFPVGAQGPIDHPLDRWKKIADAWISDAVVPIYPIKACRSEFKVRR